MAISVELIAHTPEPEKVIAMSAHLCYSDVGATEIGQNLNDKEIARFVRMMVNSGHHSTLEHVSFTFAIEGISRACTHQLVRHRIASYSQQSQRYVKANDFVRIMPNTIKNKPEAKEKFDKLMEEITAVYGELLEMGIPAEDARFVLPNAAETKIVCTFNARSLLHFFEERCCNRAQWEIRAMANMMLAEVRKVAPVLFAKAGPTCQTARFCREGKKGCGLLAALLEQDKKATQEK